MTITHPIRSIGGIPIRPATPGDLPSLLELLGRNVPEVAPDTVWQLPWSWQHYQVAGPVPGDLVAAGSLQPLGHGRAEIRGVVVDRAARGTGLATAIVQSLIDTANDRRLNAVCVTRKPEFFRRFGFEETIPAWLALRRRHDPNARRLPPRITMALPEPNLNRRAA